MDDGKEKLLAAVEALLAAVDAEVAGHRPRCDASGACCRFEAYGHRLYVTRAELLYFADRLPSAPPLSVPSGLSLPQLPGCPYQIDGLCTARQRRPMGCRIYFCDPGAQHWQGELYERYHEQLKGLHETHNLEYGYLEWRAALQALIPTKELPDGPT